MKELFSEMFVMLILNSNHNRYTHLQSHDAIVSDFIFRFDIASGIPEGREEYKVQNETL